MQIKAEEISSIIKEKIKGFRQAGRCQGDRLGHSGRRRDCQGLWPRRSHGRRNARIPRRPLWDRAES